MAHPHDAAHDAEAQADLEAAIHAWRAVIEAHPDDEVARERLAELLLDLGDAGPADRPPRHVPDDADLVTLLDRFRGREGVHARMWLDPDGGVGWGPVHQPFTPAVWRAHLDGAVTAGVYLVRADDHTSLLCFDLDLAPDHRAGDARVRAEADLRDVSVRLRDALRAHGLDPVAEDSGYKGQHLWIFLASPTAAAEVRAFGLAVARTVPRPPSVQIEVFPKQGRVGSGLGNLVKLPLGIHLRTGRRSTLLDDDGAPLADPFARLRDLAPGTLPSLPPGPSQHPTVGPPEDDAALDAVLRGCPVLRTLAAEGSAGAALGHDAALVLVHTLGHLRAGVELLRELLPDTTVHRQRGSPMGCPKIRKRLPDLTLTVACRCRFPDRAGHHAHPVRHADDLPVVTTALTVEP